MKKKRYSKDINRLKNKKALQSNGKLFISSGDETTKPFRLIHF
jgi:hypothetical protein